MQKPVAYRCSVLVSGITHDALFGGLQYRFDHVLGNALLGHPFSGVVTVTNLHPRWRLRYLRSQRCIFPGVGSVQPPPP